jgi:hypothetical protein
VRIQEPKDAACTERLEEPYDLAGATYRVILGCCTQEKSARNTNHRRLAPAKATTTVRAKEVIS